MITEFKIQNFRSYAEEVIFSMEAVPQDLDDGSVSRVRLEDGTEENLVNSAVLMGANASGKSNVLVALWMLIDMVKGSRAYDVKTPLIFQPFMLDEESRFRPTKLELTFLSGGRKYIYRICYTTYCFHEESLREEKDGKIDTLYCIRRKDQNDKGSRTGKIWGDPVFRLDEERLLPNQLLMSVIGARDAGGLEQVYSDLTDISVHLTRDVINLIENISEVAETLLIDNQSELFGQLKELVKRSDLGITDMQMKRYGEKDLNLPLWIQPEEKMRILKQNRVKFEFRHAGCDFNLPLDWESTGTKHIIAVGSRVLNALYRGEVLVMDEFNIALHSALFRHIVALFNSPVTNPRHAQLIFTTQDATIADDAMMRADQIWLAEKDNEGKSSLYSIQDFEDAPLNGRFGNWYRVGRFGSIPKI